MPSTMVPSSIRAMSTSSAEETVVSRAICCPGTSSRLNVAGISVTGGGLKKYNVVTECVGGVQDTYGGGLRRR